MSELLTYKTLPEWTPETLPAGFMQNHNTQEGTWAQLQVLQGTLSFAMTDEQGNTLSLHTFSPENPPPRIEPKQWHRIVSASADMRCQLRFLCRPEDYPSKKYRLTRPHSELIEALPRLGLPARAKALDVGCGRGRNSLYMALHGLQVQAVDHDTQALQALTEMAQAETQAAAQAHKPGWGSLQTAPVDLNQAAQQTVLHGQHDLLVCTVVLMFLQPQAAPAVVRQMQAATAPGGYNLIVCAMNTHDYPCTQPFPFTLGEGELASLYQGWRFHKYNENPGHLHKTDANGQPIALRFATLLAQKA